MLADVRAVALSRKRDFSKNSLKAHLEAEGIAYIHLVELGDAKTGREAARAGRFDEFRRIYITHLKGPEAVGALKVLLEITRSVSTCLLCFERDPKTCHRTIVANRMKARGIEVVDLFCDNPDHYVRYASMLSRRITRQGNAQSQPEIR
jgi:uncharacterized protein (DUF488 family)